MVFRLLDVLKATLSAIIFERKTSLKQMYWDVVGSGASSLQIKACFYLAARDKYGPDTWDVPDWTTTCLALLQGALAQQQPNNSCFTAVKAANPVTQCILCTYDAVCACVCAWETQRTWGNADKGFLCCLHVPITSATNGIRQNVCLCVCIPWV